MEAISGVLLIACMAGFIAVVLLLGVLTDVVMNRLHEQRVRRRAGLQEEGRTHLFYRGIAFLQPVTRIIMSLGKVRDYGKRLSDALIIKGYRAQPEAVMSLLLGVLVIIGVAALVLSGSVLCGCVIAAGIVLGLGMWATRQSEAQRVCLREALPEALQSMKACFQVGYSLPQTIQEISTSTKGSLGQLFGQVASILETGGSIEEALEVLKRRGSESELVFLAAALEIQHRTGSSMQQVLEAARQSVVDEIELKRALHTQTAQAKLSAQIVTLMPFVLIGIFSLVSPGFMDPFFESAAGLVLLAIALAMQVAGISLVRKMLNVEVG